MKTLIISSSLSHESKSFLLCKKVYKQLNKNKINVEIIDARTLSLTPFHTSKSEEMINLTNKISSACPIHRIMLLSIIIISNSFC